MTDTRHDGWTEDRQLTFLLTLRRTRSVSAAAWSAGMSREGAYRFRRTSPGRNFARFWGLALALPRDPKPPVHKAHTHLAPTARPVGFPQGEVHENHASHNPRHTVYRVRNPAPQ